MTEGELEFDDGSREVGYTRISASSKISALDRIWISASAQPYSRLQRKEQG